MNIEHDSGACKPSASPEQQTFLDILQSVLDGAETHAFVRLTGGPGTGKSFSISKAAEAAAGAGWAVILIGPTHQAVGVLAASVPLAYPYEPDGKTGLAAGAIVTATAHRVGQWVQKSRARGAAEGQDAPVPVDSWLGRSLKLSWVDPPVGVVMLADEISMYTHGMARALEAVLATVRSAGARTVLVGVGDPFQLTPVRGDAYRLQPDEQPASPSLFLTQEPAAEVKLAVNQRAKDAVLRQVVQCYLDFQRVLPPPEGSEVYQWRRMGDTLWRDWAALIAQSEPGDCIALGYRRKTVAHAGDMIHRILHGAPAGQIEAGRHMRVQETFSPRGRTIAASSDLVVVDDLIDLDEHMVVEAILPPEAGHRPAHAPETLIALREIVSMDVERFGPLPAANVRVLGDRSGYYPRVPVAVATAGDAPTTSETRWASLISALSMAAFRSPQLDATVRRGLQTTFFHLQDSARLKLEPPYAMTSHRSQGSTFKHVLVLADSQTGGVLVNIPDTQSRHASSYVMLSRASQTLTIGWV